MNMDRPQSDQRFGWPPDFLNGGHRGCLNRALNLIERRLHHHELRNRRNREAGRFMAIQAVIHRDSAMQAWRFPAIHVSKTNRNPPRLDLSTLLSKFDPEEEVPPPI
jgi:hypothetical protein